MNHGNVLMFVECKRPASAESSAKKVEVVEGEQGQSSLGDYPGIY